MLSQVLALAAFTQVAIAAVSSLAVVGFPNVNLSGSIDGTGVAGTTYVLQGVDTIGTLIDPFTMTLAEDSSELLETVDLPSASLVVLAECTLSGSLGLCEDIAKLGTALTSTIVETVLLNSIENPVTIANGTATGASSTSNGASNPSSSSSSTASGASSTQSLLPPVISPTSPPATVGPSPAPAPAPTVSSSGRGANALDVLSILPVLVVFAFVGAL